MNLRASSGAVIHRVDPMGIGYRSGLAAGDRLLTINGQAITDLIDYSWQTAEKRLRIQVAKADGATVEIHIRKDEYQGLGIDFEEAVFDRITPCANRCVFCFVDQMTSGQRPSLYIKDDDYRLSFLQGSYITLTNLRPADWERIRRLRLSPLYVSVHATDPAVREYLLGSPKASRILEELRRLGEMGIQCHTQAVICPGINDGAVLEQTIRDLSALWPTVASLAVVPVGLTSHRDGLPALRKFHPDEARQVISLIEEVQSTFLDSMGTRWIWPADEFYLQAGVEIPDYDTYEDYEQLENGVGLWRLMKDEVMEAIDAHSEALAQMEGRWGIVTGLDAAGLWRSLSVILRDKAPQIQIEVYPVANRFFGPEVTVAGLVVGGDILEMLKKEQPDPDTQLLIPSSMLRRGEDCFLDGMSLSELQNGSGFRINAVEVSGEAFIEALCRPGEDEP